jgi:hypothetical protein
LCHNKYTFAKVLLNFTSIIIKSYHTWKVIRGI